MLFIIFANNVLPLLRSPKISKLFLFIEFSPEMEIATQYNTYATSSAKKMLFKKDSFINLVPLITSLTLMLSNSAKEISMAQKKAYHRRELFFYFFNNKYSRKKT